MVLLYFISNLLIQFLLIFYFIQKLLLIPAKLIQIRTYFEGFFKSISFFQIYGRRIQRAILFYLPSISHYSSQNIVFYYNLFRADSFQVNMKESRGQSSAEKSQKSSNKNEADQNNKSTAKKQEELKEIILSHQDSDEKGYYTFENWKKLHSALFVINQHTLTTTVINGWRILKLINFGDDFVPTGLIFDTLITVINVEQTADQAEYLLKSIFFKFIEFNGKYLSEKERDQLAFFRVVRSVVEGYRKIILQNWQTSQKEYQNQNQEKSIDRNEQLYKLHNVFTYKKNLEALKKIEGEFKQCTFEPTINSKSQMAQSRYLQPKQSQSHHIQSHRNHMIIDEEDQYPDHRFRANPVPFYPEVSPNGLNEHLSRMQKSREIQRINSLKPYKTNSDQRISEFSIFQREGERKVRDVQNYKILFLIKAEVGKKMYRIKVRQNMSCEDVVRNIELMVGFQDDSVAEVVNQYFQNFRRKQEKEAIYTEQ